MAVHFFTDEPQELLRKFDSRVRQSTTVGRIHGWIKDADSASYTNADAEWINKSWLKPRLEATALVFNIIRPHDRYVSVKAYAFYHGQIIETFLNHLDLAFDAVSLTSRCSDEDINA